MIAKATFNRPEHESNPQKFEALGADTIIQSGPERATRIENRCKRAKQRREEARQLVNVDVVEETNETPGNCLTGDETTSTSTKKKRPWKNDKVRANKPRLRTNVEDLGT